MWVSALATVTLKDAKTKTPLDRFTSTVLLTSVCFVATQQPYGGHCPGVEKPSRASVVTLEMVGSASKGTPLAVAVLPPLSVGRVVC